ncbi:GNAT family N-acetyltransferase [Microbacterium sp.]|mgnify:FL=1|uniref:GNAT family N-acetyltransferase n=1 Tax=Microbacterium sp. TaxID=51671 RepID=UPI000928689F|nr:GNAT family N-acetyltransferase [Microbacterium sp.]MBN9190984.1 GNAT family N-acetyltransferase [Microbacterium sp.]OJU57716.1 MAG: GNAT family N-acetyltransferase [Microbacterium sp. 70-38]
MPTITIEPATKDRFSDAEHALTGGGDGASCQCQWWMLTNKDFNATSKEEREGLLKSELTSGPPPALVAYVDGEAAGWVRVGPRTTQVRLARTRTYAASPQPWDDENVWAVSCFAVRREHRGQGLNARLLDAAIDYARQSGARILEAYPVDTDIDSKSANELYHGVLSTFEAAGFHEVARPKPAIAIVELELTS